MELETKQENRLAGIVGALIGSIIGGMASVLVGQLGWISAVSGVILAFSTLKGYETLGKGLSKAGILVCIVLMLATPYLADRISWAMVIVKEFGWLFGDAFLYVHDVIAEFGLEADYWKDLLFVYAFTALGAITILKQTFKQVKRMEKTAL